MAKHVIKEGYTFSPSTSTITVTGKGMRREQVMLITNVTRGTVIYNFSDPNLGFSVFTNSYAWPTETTTMVLSYNTGSMSSSDKISILYEETYTEITPAETSLDPVGKLRVSNPQALIDTDFEYGTQPTKWESTTLLNNRPTAFYNPTQALNVISTISSITASGTTVTVSIASTAGIVIGQPVFVIDALDSNANGWWVVDTVSTNSNFTYKTLAAPAATLFDANKTLVFAGSFYTGSSIPTASITIAASVATVTTTYAHGLQVNNQVFIVGTTGATGLNGTYTVTSTPTNSTFTFATASTGTVTLSGALTTCYPKALGYVIHRAFDGGVQFTNLQPYHGYQIIRQTRRYFRYQSGKGIQFSTGSTVKPSLNVDSITSSGTTCTVTVKFNHGLQPGAQVQISGATQGAYNGIFTVVSVPSITTFTYTAASTPTSTPATGFPLNVAPYSWYGSKNRLGFFDSQNGFFFEYDGQSLYAVKRSSVNQLGGTIAVTAGTQLVTGTNTLFSDSVKPGDFVVIRGMSYLVQSIMSNTSMIIYPEYRGVTASGIVCTKTTDERWSQSQWNIDKMDGTGESLFNLDLTKMQMFYIDYTWYGAGAIRFGFKNNRGEVIYCHRVPNNNVNGTAYMRSGNMCARYETNTFAPTTYATASLSSAALAGSTINGVDFSNWPNSGTCIMSASGATGAAIEYITYTSRTNTALTIGSRAQAGGAATAQAFTYSLTAPIKIELYSPAAACTISHWGSSVVMDGRYDDDKSLQFNIAMNTALTNLNVGTRYALISLRSAPSVDNGFTGLLGAREIINRMQVIMRQLNAYTTQPFRVELILNGIPSSGTFAPVGGSSLSQYILHGSSTTITGGESMYTFFTGVNTNTSQDIGGVRDLGTSILGGGTTLAVPTSAQGLYPDGPDIITVCATCVGTSTNSINASIAWTEAQA